MMHPLLQTKGPDAYAISNNIVNQNFIYLSLADKRRRYNCTVIDLYDRRVGASVGGKRINTELTVNTILKALGRSGGETEMILHSGRGSQFTSKSFVEFCIEHGITQIMNQPGYRYGNAPMERYFNTLKSELVNLHSYPNEETLYNAILTNSYVWYNNQRPHSFNRGLPPAKVA